MEDYVLESNNLTLLTSVIPCMINHPDHIHIMRDNWNIDINGELYLRISILGHVESNSKEEIFYCNIIYYFSLYDLIQQWNEIEFRLLLNFAIK